MTRPAHLATAVLLILLLFACGAAAEEGGHPPEEGAGDEEGSGEGTGQGSDDEAGGDPYGGSGDTDPEPGRGCRVIEGGNDGTILGWYTVNVECVKRILRSVELGGL